jgi:hypothetical protein
MVIHPKWKAANRLGKLRAKNARIWKYEACLSGGLRLIPSTPHLQALGADYEKMIANGMFEGEPPNFQSIVKRLQTLEKQINSA